MPNDLFSNYLLIYILIVMILITILYYVNVYTCN